jgi:membrane fusion protein
MFRAEVIEAQRMRLEGAVVLAGPNSWFALTILYVVLILGVGVYLAVGSYARTETVRGRLFPTKGVVAVTPSASGVVTEVLASDGTTVVAGAPLVSVRVAPTMLLGPTAVEGALNALAEQIAASEKQIELSAASVEAEIDRLQAEIAGASSELAALEEQFASQVRMAELARSEVHELRPVVERGAVSRRDLQRREETQITREQQLASLRQQKAQATSRRDQAERQIPERRAAFALERGRIEVVKAELAQRRAELEGRNSYTLRAPVDGRVTAVTVRNGDAVQPSRPLMAIVPEGVALEAELYVPTAAIGFVREGQEVRLRIDAFPYQRFGTTPARVSRVAQAPTIQNSPASRDANPTAREPEVFYLVTAALGRSELAAFGRTFAFQPGMTLQATIITERRSLFEWLFEPVLAVRQRT